MNANSDDKLGELLRQLAREKRRGAPAFSQVWRAATENQRESRPAFLWRPAFAVGVLGALCAAGLTFFSMHERKPIAGASPTAVVHTGYASAALPTDFLFSTNDDGSVRQLADEIDALLQP